MLEMIASVRALRERQDELLCELEQTAHLLAQGIDLDVTAVTRRDRARLLVFG
jgi:hypothetical protein